MTQVLTKAWPWDEEPNLLEIQDKHAKVDEFEGETMKALAGWTRSRY
jgi:hypothetical protein